jgi:hypothetical protein
VEGVDVPSWSEKVNLDDQYILDLAGAAAGLPLRLSAVIGVHITKVSTSVGRSKLLPPGFWSFETRHRLVCRRLSLYALYAQVDNGMLQTCVTELWLCASPNCSPTTLPTNCTRVSLYGDAAPASVQLKDRQAKEDYVLQETNSFIARVIIIDNFG